MLRAESNSFQGGLTSLHKSEWNLYLTYTLFFSKLINATVLGKDFVTEIKNVSGKRLLLSLLKQFCSLFWTF